MMMTAVAELELVSLPRPVFEEVAISRRIYMDYPPEQYAEKLLDIGSLAISDLEKVETRFMNDPELTAIDREALKLVFNNKWLDTHGKK